MTGGEFISYDMCERIYDPYPKVEHINLNVGHFCVKINEGALQDFGLGKGQIPVNFNRFKVIFFRFLLRSLIDYFRTLSKGPSGYFHISIDF